MKVPNKIDETSKVEIKKKEHPKKESLLDTEKVMAYWNIKIIEEPRIHCVNTVTGRVFEGTREEFNIFVRG